MNAITNKTNSDLKSDLPDPKDFPGSDVVIYDGKCNFCKAQVARLHWLDGKNRLTFLSLHDERVKELCPDLSFEDLMEQMYVVTPNGESYGGAAAVRYLSRRLPKIWFAAPLMHIPFSLPVWQWMYQKVAERRYRIAGMTEECEGGTCQIHFDKHKQTSSKSN